MFSKLQNNEALNEETELFQTFKGKGHFQKYNWESSTFTRLAIDGEQGRCILSLVSNMKRLCSHKYIVGRDILKSKIYLKNNLCMGTFSQTGNFKGCSPK